MTETKPTNPKDAVGIRKYPGSVIPRNVLGELGLAMLEGARKYGRHNYRVAGVRASVYFDAVSARHLDAWWEGEDIDPESGVHHITKAIAGLTVLRDSIMRGNWVDDRPPRVAAGWQAELNQKAGEIIDRYPDALPAHTHADEVAVLQTRIEQSVLAAFVVEGTIGPGDEPPMGEADPAQHPELFACPDLRQEAELAPHPEMPDLRARAAALYPEAPVEPARILAKDLTEQHEGLRFRVVTADRKPERPATPQAGFVGTLKHSRDGAGETQFAEMPPGMYYGYCVGPNAVLEFIP